MTLDALRVKYADLLVRQRRAARVHAAVRDALSAYGLPASHALAGTVAMGRYWFSVWDACHAPWHRLQRFEA